MADDNKFGFIVMDGNGALFGTLSGNTREVLHKFTVDLPKKHGEIISLLEKYQSNKICVNIMCILLINQYCIPFFKIYLDFYLELSFSSFSEKLNLVFCILRFNYLMIN